MTRWNPTPPERGSFPLDHFGECTEQMQQYLKCLKLVRGNNAPNCRLLAKEYLGCRMENKLMEQSDWDSLGLPKDAKEELSKTAKSETNIGSNDTQKNQ